MLAHRHTLTFARCSALISAKLSHSYGVCVKPQVHRWPTCRTWRGGGALCLCSRCSNTTNWVFERGEAPEFLLRFMVQHLTEDLVDLNNLQQFTVCSTHFRHLCPCCSVWVSHCNTQVQRSKMLSPGCYFQQFTTGNFSFSGMTFIVYHL